MQIVSLAQAQPTWTGWKAFENDRNRHALATALTDNTSELFRDMWYNYHRKGLDEMAANPDRGRTTIIGLLPVLEQVKSARPTSPLLQSSPIPSWMRSFDLFESYYTGEAGRL